MRIQRLIRVLVLSLGATLALLAGLHSVRAAPGAPPGSEFLLSRGVHEMQRYAVSDYNAARGEYLVAWSDEGTGATYATYGQRLAADGAFTGSQAISITSGVYVRDVAYNSISDTHLVVWYGGAPMRIGGQIVSGSGALVGAPITISMLTGDQFIPAVAYNSVDNLWLVTWFSGTSGSDLYGQLVRTDGTLEGGAIGITVGAPGTQRDVVLAYDSADDEFLVVWQDDRNGNNDIWARRLKGSTGAALGSEIQVITQTSHQWRPSVAYNPTDKEYLIVWTDWNGFDVRARRVAADGSLPAADFLVSTHLGTESSTNVVYNAASGEYLVAWHDDRGGANADDIYAQRVSSTGTLVGNDFPIVVATGWQTGPRLACHASGECLATWGDPRTGGNDYDIYARRFTSTGAPAGAEFVVSVAPHHAGAPAVAANTFDGSALAVWNGNPTGGSSYNIYGQVIRSSGTLSGANLALSSSGTHKTSPNVAYNSADHNYLAAWVDYQSGNYYIYGHIISASGALSGTNDLFIANAENAGGQPSLAYNAANNEYLVAYVDAYEDMFLPIYYYRIRASRLSRSSAVFTSTSFGDYTDTGQDNPDVAHGSGRNLYVTVWHSSTLAYGQVVSASGALSGMALVISPTTAYQNYPAIAYNSAADEFLTTWIQYTGPSTSTIYARRLSGAGVPVGTPFTVTDILTYTQMLDLAYDANRNEYLLAWSDKRIPPADYDLHAQRLAADGTPLGDKLLLSGAQNDQTEVALSYNPVRREYLAVWQDRRNQGTDIGSPDDIYGVSVPARPDLSLSSKSVTSDTARPGDVITYTVVVANGGLISATAALSDAIPANTAYVPDSTWASAGAVNDAAGIRWNGVVTSGESVTVTFAARLNVPLATNTKIVNRAYITDTFNTVPITRVVTTTVQTPAFTLVKSDSPDPVFPDANLTYTIRLTNAGAAEASGVVVTETYDSNWTFLGADPAPSISNNIWNLGGLGVGATRTITITGKVNGSVANGTVLTNSVTLDSDQTAPQQASATTVASSGPLLALTKSAPSTIEPGELLTYTIRIANNGLGNATGTVVTDALPLSITSGYAAPSPDAGVIAAGGTITWVQGTLGVGQSDWITLVVTVATPMPNGTVLTNTARAACSEGAASFGQATTTIYWPAALTVTKMDTPDPVAAGGALTYTIWVANTGGAAAWDVEVLETYDSRFIYQSATPAPASGNAYWYTPTLNSGQVYAITITGRVTETALPGDVLTNAVTVMWWEFGIIPHSTSATITTRVAYSLYLPVILRN